MGRPIRVLYGDAVYHVTARGNQRRRIFNDDSDRELFMETLLQCVALHGIKVHGYCLMPNHYHLLLETPQGNLSRARGWLADDLYRALQPQAAELKWMTVFAPVRFRPTSPASNLASQVARTHRKRRESRRVYRGKPPIAAKIRGV